MLGRADLGTARLATDTRWVVTGADAAGESSEEGDSLEVSDDVEDMIEAYLYVEDDVFLKDQFVLSDVHFEMARRGSIAYQEHKGKRIPTEMIMLAIVYDVKGETKFQLCADPWNLYQRMLLRLKPTANFIAALPMADKM